MTEWAYRSILLLAAVVVPSIIDKLIPRVRRAIVRYLERSVRPDPNLAVRVRTITRASRKGLVILIRALLVGLFLSSVGVDMTWVATLAAAVSVALGFGARRLVGDILAGIFILAENRIRVGDDVQVNGIQGHVHEIRLRTISILDQDDHMHYVSCGSVRSVADLNWKAS